MSFRHQPSATTILLVETSPSFWNSSARFWKGRVSVLSVATAEAAIQIEKGLTGPIDLLLTDVSMPRLPAPELAEQLEGRQYSNGSAGVCISQLH